MQIHKTSHSIQSVFPLLLLLAFCLFALVLSGTGAIVYKNSAAQLEENYTSRTAVSYISEKIRQHNRYEPIELSELDGIPALKLRETIEQETYYTYIYFYDQAVHELFIHEHTEASADMGTALVSLSSLEFYPISDRQLLSVTAVSPEGNTLSMMIHCICTISKE